MALLVLLGAVFSFFFPSVTSVIRTSWVPFMLGLVMFGMGLTMQPEAFAVVFRRPKDVILGSLCQFTIMPLLAVGLSFLFKLPPELAVGVILVGCCPGGTSSNVITYLSHGDLPLSVGLTSVSTLLSPLLTPWLFKLYAGTYIPVDVWMMFLSIIEVILAPIALGLLVRKFLPVLTEKAAPYLPAFSSVVIICIVMAVVSVNVPKLHSCGLLVILVVILHNFFGYILGFVVGRLAGFPMPECVTVSIEVGMQNSGLACSLAATNLPSMVMAGLPGAVFSVWHNISGAIIARIYSRRQHDIGAGKKTSDNPSESEPLFFILHKMK